MIKRSVESIATTWLAEFLVLVPTAPVPLEARCSVFPSSGYTPRTSASMR